MRERTWPTQQIAALTQIDSYYDNINNCHFVQSL